MHVVSVSSCHRKVWPCVFTSACTSVDENTSFRDVCWPPAIMHSNCCLGQVLFRPFVLTTQPLQLWTHYLQVVNHLTTTTQPQPLLCLTTHLPCAHWKGRSHNSRSAMSSSLWLRVSGSPNLMAPWQAKLFRMVRSEGGTICDGWPASVHYRYTEGKRTILVKQVSLQQCTQARGCLVS